MGRNARSKAIGNRAAPHTVVRRAPARHRAMHRGTTRSEHYSNHQMRWTLSGPSAIRPPPPSTRCPRTPQGQGLCPTRQGVPATGGGNRAVTSPPCAGRSTSCGDVKSLCGGAGGWDRSGCTQGGAPRSANGQGEEQHSHTKRRSHTTRDKEEGGSEAGEASRTAGTGNQKVEDGEHAQGGQ